MGIGAAWCGRHTVNVEIQVGSLPIIPAIFKEYIQQLKIHCK
jgi:hypothetical protein